MENSGVRVRFAPSPTGGLHLGGVRTVLYNYLFAKKHGGKFILRIEDTDQNRYVEGAEEYIFDCLSWCGLSPDESPLNPGLYGPYRQSERKDIYAGYAMKLVKQGHAYIAFDTPAELEKMRERLKAGSGNSLQYDHRVRMEMRNSLTLSESETVQLIDSGTPYVIRIKIQPEEPVEFNDLIRGRIEFDTSNVDDKVLMKADGMPTYHLAVVVDDHLMKITHAFRGEEWLPSAPVHILLWKNLFGLDKMPEWAHLPLILKPDGNGKLSKRDGDRLGFPVYAMNWKDPVSGEITAGFKENGFLPESFLNLLALLGWNDGTQQELFTLNEMIEKFSLDRIHTSGAKFDYEKAKWFNHEWLKKLPASYLSDHVLKVLKENNIPASAGNHLNTIIDLVKDRCTLIPDFIVHAGYFFITPSEYDEGSVLPKWDENKSAFFHALNIALTAMTIWDSQNIETTFKNIAAEKGIKVGELQMILRILLVGIKAGPAVFVISDVLGKDETILRINKGTQHFNKMKQTS